MVVADAAPAALASPSYKVSIAYPVATVKGASSLAMSLAAATVLATLFWDQTLRSLLQTKVRLQPWNLEAMKLREAQG
jgi:hypothetical protein